MVATVPFTSRSPEVREYLRLRRASRKLNERLVQTVPRAALDEIGDALRLVRDDGVFHFPYQDAVNVLMDCCIHDWLDGGKTVVQKYAETPETGRLPEDERTLLAAWARAEPALLRIDEQWPGAGVRVHDAVGERDLVLLDRDLSLGPDAIDAWLVARIAPVGAYWMTTGATTVLGNIDEPHLHHVLGALGDVRRRGGTNRDIALALAHLGLTVQAAFQDPEDLEDEDAPSPVEQRRFAALPPRPAGRNDPCPCGSGKKYKRCCGG